MKDRIVIREGRVEYWLDNQLVEEAAYRERYPLPSSDGPVAQLPTGTWPLLSEAMAVHPKQIGQAREVSRRHGVPTDFTPDGRAILTSAAHRKEYCRLYGIHDRNGGYGDP